MRLKIIAVFLLALVLPMSGFASQSAQQMVQSVADNTIAKLKSERVAIEKDPGRLYELINEFVLPHFDFERMSKWVLGKHWRSASPAQRQKFVSEFRTLLVRTYATSLKDYSDQEISYLPFRDSETAEEVTVRSEVAQPGGFPIPINYRLSKINGEWKVFDVTIDDISLVSNYRTSFSKEIRNGGVDGLIATLSERNQKAK